MGAILFDNSLHIFGGIDFDIYPRVPRGKVLKTTEIISADGKATKSIDLPQEIAGHAIAAINETFSIITGGIDIMHNALDSTWYYNHVTREFTTGPKLQTSRQWHSSGSLTD